MPVDDSPWEDESAPPSDPTLRRARQLFERAAARLHTRAGRAICRRRGAVTPTSSEELAAAGRRLFGPESLWIGSYSEMQEDLGNATLPEWLSSIPARAAVVLFRWEQDYGHWICTFLQDDGRLQIFDSTGHAPDSLRLTQSPRSAAQLGQSARAMVHALRRGGRLLPAFYNDARLQSPGNQTCGRWCVLRLALRDMTENEFSDFVVRSANCLMTSPDIFCVAATC